MDILEFRCKSCGGDLIPQEGQAGVAKCRYCDMVQTIPQPKDEKQSNLHSRAAHFRHNNEFDKAMGIYEKILLEDDQDAEAYWSLILCLYGIEYVEDPATKRRLPTVNRAQYTSVYDDENYKCAIRYANPAQKAIYEAEAAAINEIQKGILAISQNEEPFDVFICYKETDKNGRRTRDSVIAQELYGELEREGFRVFFARVTLEDKLGQAYEPYIFAALQSSKVMVALGTSAEHFNAVWVKNEWSRYLALIKNGAKKVLIPAYRDMDPYDLPEEFSHLQGQDMNRLGFMQDLTRGIRKIVEADRPAPATVIHETVKEKTVVVENVAPVTVAAGGAVNSAAPLLKRAFMFLEDGEFEKADDFCEQVLNLDPENAKAYLGKLMAELRVKNKEKLKDCDKPFDDKNNYKKAVRFGDSALKAELDGYIDFIKKRNEIQRLDALYNDALKEMNAGAFVKAADKFRALSTYRDASFRVSECLQKQREKEEKDRENTYQKGVSLMNASSNLEQSYAKAIQIFESLKGYKDSEACIERCQDDLKKIHYRQACSKKNQAKSNFDFKDAAKLFDKLGDYSDSKKMAAECRNLAQEVIDKKYAQDVERERLRIEAANREVRNKRIKRILITLLIIGVIAAVVAIAAYFGYIAPLQKADTLYDEATELYEAGKYEEALTVFEKADEQYRKCIFISFDSEGEARSAKCSYYVGDFMHYVSYYDPEVLVVPETVTALDRDSFDGCSSVTCIVIPDHVTTNEEYMFDYWKSASVFCEADTQPEGWAYGWNYGYKDPDVTVYWGGQWEYVDGVPTPIETEAE